MKKILKHITLTSFVFSLMFFIFLPIGKAEAASPTCSIQASPETGNAPLSVNFSAVTTGAIRRYWWNFGDGAGVRDVSSASHSYASPGTYTVNLSVRDRYGNTVSATPVIITVMGEPVSPVSIEAVPLKGEAPLTVDFTSVTKNIIPRRYWWSFGDGSGTRDVNAVSHTYTDPGEYTVNLTIRDRIGNTTSAEVEIDVESVSPTSLTKDLGKDYPDAIIWGSVNTSEAGGALQAIKGDIDGNGFTDLIFTGRINGEAKRYVAVFYDATLSSINGRSFTDADFMIVTQKKYPWQADAIKEHSMHWMAVDDLNQDGYDDIIFAMPIIDLGGGARDEKGEVYVVLGGERSALGTYRDFSVDPPDFTFVGNEQGDRAGFSVATGDINGDGQADILIGAPLADGPGNLFVDGGEVYVVTHIEWSQPSIVLTESNVDLYIYGESGRKYGEVVIAGNLNGDYNTEATYPVDDIVIAPKQGSVKIFFGAPSHSKYTFFTSAADWTSDYIMDERSPNMAVGDINDDGIDDLIIGDAREISCLHYGSTGTISTLSDVVINSAHINDGFGDRFDFSKFCADFNGDGYQDLAILAPRSRGQFNQYVEENNISPFVGETHIIWGGPSVLSSTIDLTTEGIYFSLYGSNGTDLTGLSTNFKGAWNSTYGYVFGMELEDESDGAELFFSDCRNLYIYKINP